MFLRISPETVVNTKEVIAVSKTDKNFELKFFCSHARIISISFETEVLRTKAMKWFIDRTNSCS